MKKRHKPESEVQYSNQVCEKVKDDMRHIKVSSVYGSEKLGILYTLVDEILTIYHQKVQSINIIHCE